jgi:hypothetical protein
MMAAQKMTLPETRSALERHGFSCVDDDETPNMLVGVLSECRWSMMAKMDVMVFVHHVEENLTIDRIEKDLSELPDLVQDHYVGRCPPFGAARGRTILLVYLTDQQIEPVALGKIRTVPSKEWCTLTFLAAQDGEGVSHFLESSTPLWGKGLYPETRYWAGLLTGRDVPPQRPQASKYLVLVNILCLVLVVFTALTAGIPASLWVVYVGYMVILFGGAWVYDWCCRRQGRRNPNGRATDSGTDFVRLALPETGEHML